MKLHALIFAAGSLAMSGCDVPGRAGEAPAETASAAALTPALPAASGPLAVPAASAAPMVAGLDVGRTSTQATRAPGAGPSLADAVNDAIRTAILQVNGSAVDLDSQQFKFALGVATAYSDVNIRASGFAEVVQQRSRGAITGFKLESAEGPDAKGQYKVWIEAQVARYTPPEGESRKLKLVVAPIRFDVASFTVGGRSVPADEVAADIHRRVLERLAQSGRFAVLDRAFDAEVQQELDLVESGQAPNSQFGKLGQAFSADLVWVGRIQSLGYVRHARQLRASDRTLVSYSGGWAVTQKLVNVATRQVMLANSLQDQLPTTAPTTLGASIDSQKTLTTLTEGIAQQVVASIMATSFPVSIVSRDGNAVVLSQGANALKPGGRYQVIALGAELKDPQTGQSLGRVEGPCCQVVVDRVTPTLSYGHLEAIGIALDQVPAGGLLVRETVAGPSSTAAAPGARSRTPARAGGRDDDMGDPTPPASSRRSDADW